MKKLSKKELKDINGGGIRFPDSHDKCPAGWYLCPTNICVDDKGGEKPIREGHPYYTACFG